MTLNATRRRAFRTLLFTAAMAAALPAFAQDVVGRNSAVKGDVTIQSIDEAVRTAVIKEDVRLGDDITSALESSLQILLLDETVFTVGPSAQMVIDRFVYDPSQNNNAMAATVKRGMFRFMSGNISREAPDEVEIGTPVASLGIRGTIVEGLVGQDAIDFARANGLIDPNLPVDPNGASIFVLRGPGNGNTGQDRDGRVEVNSGGGSVNLTRPGQAAFVQNANADPVFFQMDEAGFEFFSERLRTKPKPGNGYQPFQVPPASPPASQGKGAVDFEEPFDPLTDFDWPETGEDFFDSPCGPTICDCESGEF